MAECVSDEASEALPFDDDDEADEEDTSNTANYLEPRQRYRTEPHKQPRQATKKEQLYENRDDSSPSSSTTTETNSGLKNLTLRDLVRFAAEIARGMDYLASKKVIVKVLSDTFTNF